MQQTEGKSMPAGDLLLPSRLPPRLVATVDVYEVRPKRLGRGGGVGAR